MCYRFKTFQVSHGFTMFHYGSPKRAAVIRKTRFQKHVLSSPRCFRTNASWNSSRNRKKKTPSYRHVFPWFLPPFGRVFSCSKRNVVVTPCRRPAERTGGRLRHGVVVADELRRTGHGGARSSCISLDAFVKDEFLGMMFWCNVDVQCFRCQ